MGLGVDDRIGSLNVISAALEQVEVGEASAVRESGVITDIDRANFYAAFPGIKAKRRDVTADDAKTLRGLK